MSGELIASILIGCLWYIFVAIVGGISLWKCVRGFSFDLELEYLSTNGGATKRGFFDREFKFPDWIGHKSLKFLINITVFIEFLQFIALCFVDMIPWGIQDFQDVAVYFNLILPHKELLIVFWLLFSILIVHGTFYVIFQVVPLWLEWKSCQRQKMLFKKQLEEKRKLFSKNDPTSSSKQITTQPTPKSTPVSPKPPQFEEEPPPPSFAKKLIDSISLFGGFMVFEWLLFPTMLVSFEILRCEKQDGEWSLIGNSDFECWTTTHLGYIIAASISLVLSLLFGMFWNLERSNIVSEYYHHPRFSVFVVLLKGVLAGVAAVFRTRWLVASIILGLYVLYFVSVLYFQPCIGRSVKLNYRRGSIACALIWSAFTMILTNLTNSNGDLILIILWIVLIPFLAIGYGMTYWTYKFFRRKFFSGIAFLGRNYSDRFIIHQSERLLIYSLQEKNRSQMTGNRAKQFINLIIMTKNQTLRTIALQALANLVLNMDICAYAVEKTDLIIALGIRATEDAEKKQIARLVANIAVTDPNRRMMIKSNCLQLMLTFLRCTNSVEALIQTLRAIDNMCLVEEGRLILLQEGDIPFLCDLCNSQVTRMRQKAEDILLDIACNAECKEAILHCTYTPSGFANSVRQVFTSKIDESYLSGETPECTSNNNSTTRADSDNPPKEGVETILLSASSGEHRLNLKLPEIPNMIPNSIPEGESRSHNSSPRRSPRDQPSPRSPRRSPQRLGELERSQSTFNLTPLKAAELDRERVLMSLPSKKGSKLPPLNPKAVASKAMLNMQRFSTPQPLERATSLTAMPLKRK